MDWLLGFILPYFLLFVIIASLSYICLSFRLYQIGIAERSRVKKRSAFVTLLLSLIIFAGSVFIWCEVGEENLLLPFFSLFN